MSADAPPPAAPRRPVRLELHGDVRVDDYFWLRERADPAVAAYLEAENRYADAVMAPGEALREKLYREMLGHIRESDRQVLGIGFVSAGSGAISKVVQVAIGYFVFAFT